MTKIEQSKKILESIDFPQKLQTDVCFLSLLALANVKKRDKWEIASNEWIRIHDIMIFIKENYGIKYAENSRETFRKTAMHNFRNAAIIEDNGETTNSSNYKYRLTAEFLGLIQSFGSSSWKTELKAFKAEHESLISKYSSKKEVEKQPVEINGEVFSLSKGEHNKLQKAIIEEFAPRFAPNSVCLYLGDSIERDLVKNDEMLTQLGLEISVHNKMPDVILYCKDKNWMYFIEAVTSVGPMNQKRLIEIGQMLKKSDVKPVYITAFPDFQVFKKFADTIAWETEIWISDFPDHMIHMNGDRFIGPR